MEQGCPSTLLGLLGALGPARQGTQATRVFPPKRPSLENPFPVFPCPFELQTRVAHSDREQGDGRPSEGSRRSSPEHTCPRWHLLRQRPEFQKRPERHLGRKRFHFSETT